ncbi:S8 family serine peptidase [Kribbella sp. NPDC050281]|uniref:S8 family serine peptidase n=1 Tax=Kribbella sp. NPDC050281 TaxID=3155515 RepID=UPI0033E5094F
MVHSRPRPRWIAAAALALSIGLTAQNPGLPAAAAGPPATMTAGTPSAAPNRTITLITGDQITLRGGELSNPSIRRGPGREHITFRALRIKGRLTVIPSDVEADVAAGKLDRRLFDIGGLLEDHYDDASTTAIPLIVTYAARAKRSAIEGVTTTRDLPAINGSAVKLAKKDAATVLSRIRDAGPAKIWLDGKRTVSLDQSVPQIGAPVAWQAGYTGKGVSIAVLDTGVDATHPDLADRIAGTKNFTDQPPGDTVGHGTHVASTIAGTGAASGGKYRGVAPDAKLYAGKVCPDRQCSDSAILAGMEWAATELHATAVNISIGGPDTAEIDPLEEAVNRLTQETGTLFVIAAGNSGPWASSLESPGSAEAALTVGAVDKQDQLAELSSRGPRLGDGGTKPDVVAPGIDIVAARANSEGGERYVAMDGTSMATPHATGSVALLAQEHPDWKAADFKAAMMASTKHLDGLTPYEQGTGRIDVGRATQLQVTAAPANLIFNALWPHTDDTPETKPVTYRNLGDQPVALTLSATTTGPDGQPAPDGAIKLSTTSLTIPAGGIATVDVTSDTRHDGPDGRYVGSLTATGAGATVTTPYTVTKEVESYTLRLNFIGPDGEPGVTQPIIYGIDNGYYEIADASGTLKRRLPKGRYLIDNYQYTSEDAYVMVKPSTLLNADTTLTLDARRTKPMDLTVPEPEASPIISVVHYELPQSPDGYSSWILAPGPSHLHTAQVGERLPAEQWRAWFHTEWAKVAPNGFPDDSPFVYETMDPFDGYPTGFTRHIGPGDLAVVDQSLHRASHDLGGVAMTGWMDNRRVEFWPPFPTYSLPARRRLFLEGGRFSWDTEVDEIGADGFAVAGAVGAPKSYRAGHSYEEHLNVAAFTPTPLAATRSDDRLSVDFSPTTDATGARGLTLTDAANSRLMRDGQPVAESATFGSITAGGLAPEKAQYVLESSLTRPSYAAYSTRIDARWSFASAAGTKNLPLLGVRYQPTVDINNTAARTPVTTLPVVVQAQPGATLPRIRFATLQYSADGGTTWRTAPLAPGSGGEYTAIFPTPKEGKTVSLKLHLADADGNTTDLTTIDAYHLR